MLSVATLETKASQMNKIKKQVPEVPTEEELRRREEEKKIQVAATRRKFKDQYKKVLETLMLKNLMKEDEDKSSFKKLPKRPKVKSAKDENVNEVGDTAAGSALVAIRRRSATLENNENCANQLAPTAPPSTLKSVR